MSIVEKGVALKTQIVDQQVEPTVVVVVGNVQAHAGKIVPVVVSRDAGAQANFLESAVPLVVQQHLWPHVVRDKNVGPSIVIVVADVQAQAFDSQSGNTGFDGDVFEAPAALVVIESKC